MKQNCKFYEKNFEQEELGRILSSLANHEMIRL